MSGNIMIVGVGGQGTLLASRLLGAVLPGMGYDVKISEVHGMSQRGGSVVTYVRYGEKVSSPIIDKGEADFILAFEQLEAARYISYLKPNGKIIMNTQKIDPMPVIIGAMDYPENIPEKIKDLGVDIIPVDALSMAEEAGSAKAVNVVLLGVISKYLGIDPEHFEKAIETTVKPKFIDINKTAYKKGLEYNVQ